MNGTDDNLILGQAPLPEGADDCGCCAGTDVRTPSGLYNRAGLSAIAYRVGTHATFKRTMLARLSSADHPALARLRTRDDNDYSIALLDAWAAVSDVLTLCQERIANEAFLATATERLSIIELARLIGYRLLPGVAAEAHLAFTLEDAATPGEEPLAQTTVPTGTRVQSIPGPGETAQTFETVEDLMARLEWNALKPRPSRLILPNHKHDTVAYLKGTAANLNPGAAILLVGPEREADSGNENWDFRRLTRVETDPKTDTTRIQWSPGLGSDSPSKNPSANPKLYVFRQRASLFGYNAPHPKVLPQETRDNYGFTETDESIPDWTFEFTGNTIDLDTIYADIAENSWIVLSKPTYQEVYRATQVREGGEANFALSGRTTRIDVDGEHLAFFAGGAYRETAVFANAELLEFAETPIDSPVWKDSVVGDRLIDGLEEDHPLVVRGPRAKARVLVDTLVLTSDDDPPESYSIDKGEVLTLLAAPGDISGNPSLNRWHLRAENGFEGVVTADPDVLAFVAAGEDDPLVAETATLLSVTTQDELYTRLVFAEDLVKAFDRGRTVIHANVALATHGETVSEVLGSGDAGRAHQRFALKQSPLTYVGAAAATGVASTLEVRVDDVRWSEVPFLYGRGPTERVFTTHINDDGTTSLQFGDGIIGARLPSGQDNVDATHRKGTGLVGLVGANTLKMLLSKPLGVREVINPLAASGADDPETMDDARDNAPVTVRTLDRTVSLLDYEDFARSFIGIAKALASWSWDGQTRRVFVTVAGPNGAEVKESDGLHQRLLKALKEAGDPFIDVVVQSYQPVTFRLKLKIKVDPDHLEDIVLADVEATLRAAFAFGMRNFGQQVALSEVIATAQQVSGVVAVDVDRLYRSEPPNDDPVDHARLPAALPILSADGTMRAAELLTLDPGPLDGLEVMP